MGIETALDFLYGLDGRTPVIGILGGIFSSIALPVAFVSGVVKTPQLAYAASSPRLSDKDIYPFFLRTFPPDLVQGKAMWQWIVAFKIPLCMCIYGREPYGYGLYKVVADESRAAGQGSNRAGPCSHPEDPAGYYVSI